jgi:putative membrane protein
MKNTGWFRSALVSVTLLAPIVGVAATPSGSPGAAAESDRDFVTRALSINEQEVQLGRLASQQASTPEVKAMGDKMIENHTRFGQQLGGLAGQLGASPTPELSAEQRDAIARLRARTGGEFDPAFKRTVDEGHVKELAMYRDWLGRTDNPQVRTFAEGRVAALQKSVGTSAPAR